MTKVVEKYFSILEDYFGVVVERISKKRYPREEYQRAIAEVYDRPVVKPMLDSLYDELMRLDWASQMNATQRIGGLKASYIGIFSTQRPTEIPEFLKKTCLYSDTVILNDHISSWIQDWRKNALDDFSTFQAVAHFAIYYLTIKNLFLFDLNPPICTLTPPFTWFLQKSIFENVLTKLFKKTVLSFASDVFGRNFRSHRELDKFLSKMKNFNDFASRAQKPEMLIDVYGTPFSAAIAESIKHYARVYYQTELSQPELFRELLRGPATALLPLMTNGKFTFDFVTDHRGYWDHLVWLIRKDNESLFERLKKRGMSQDTLILNALQQEELRWLGNVPLNKVIELRERGELQDLRDLLAKNVHDIENATDEDFIEVGRQVKYNLEEAFKKHDAEVKGLDEKYKRKYDIDVASLMVSGSLGIISALYPPLALATGIASGIIGSGSIITTVKDFIEKREKLRDLQKKPVAILFEVRNPAI